MTFLKPSRSIIFGIATLILVASASYSLADIVSGPQPGDRVGAFTVTKAAGNPSDGVENGKSLCYRCRMGNKPVVMIFARTADKPLAKLINELEGEIEEHEDAQLSSFVNMIGADNDSLKTAATKFVKDNNIQRVAFVVPEDSKNGPDDFKISPEADMTVVCYKGGQVVTSHALKKGELDDGKISAIVESACNLVD